MTIIIKAFVVLSFPVIFALENTTNPTDELLFAHILFRHGERNLYNSYANDPYNNENLWPEGFGSLTNTGRQQQYELGSYLRRRYFNLIGNNGSYHRDTIYVQSTDIDRTLMSAAHNLAGMFPPEGKQIWNDSLLWQAIPIHTTPEYIDHILTMKRPCPKYDQAYKEYEQSAEIRAVIKRNEELIKYLELHSGQKLNGMSEIKTIYTTLLLESLRNLTLPAWTDKIFVPGGSLEEMAHLYFAMGTNKKLLARLKAGFLMRDMLERFTKKKDGTLQPNRTLHIYSAHDITLAHMLNTLGLFEPRHVPIFASAMFFELHKFNGTFHVEIYYKSYRGEDKVPLEPLSIPNCGTRCPLEKFYEIYQDVIPTEDFDTECRLPEYTTKPNRNNSRKNYRSHVTIIIGFVFLLAINLYN